ncbi:hypothetical protein B0H17DRAFT_1195526 [Mycena rosella]|uniref:Uncharacterized protein n=1 Tax=Mycena rosella TaxID=1033263 RepID=A0AAD7DXI5_MYCRO|nr:hypothetical protein B0H17DRAFT_1195526 [Mycena rosella]
MLPLQLPMQSPPLCLLSPFVIEHEITSLTFDYVDIMYMPTDGKLVCCVCILATIGSKLCAAPIQAFIPGASWDMLCKEVHLLPCFNPPTLSFLLFQLLSYEGDPVLLISQPYDQR